MKINSIVPVRKGVILVTIGTKAAKPSTSAKGLYAQVADLQRRVLALEKLKGAGPNG